MCNLKNNEMMINFGKMPHLSIEEDIIKSVWGIDLRKFPGEWTLVLHVTLNTKGCIFSLGIRGFECFPTKREDVLYMVSANMLDSWLTIITFKK